jgi:triosephosphate isomerase
MPNGLPPSDDPLCQKGNHGICSPQASGGTARQASLLHIAEREGGSTLVVVKKQLEGGLVGVTAEQMNSVVIAYEPVWAIGTGKTATPRQAEEVHHYVRKLITQRAGEAVGQGIRILYGGSVTPDNIVALRAAVAATGP